MVVKIKNIKDLLEIFFTLQITKELPRQGFFYSGFKRNEADSVAAHTFNVCIISFFMTKELIREGYKIDDKKVLEMALIHDTGESITGDIGHYVKVLAEGKFQEVEEKAVRLLFRNLKWKEELIGIFSEYNECRTPESKIVKFADALDAIFQGISTPSAQIDDWKIFTKDATSKLGDCSLFGNKLVEMFEEASTLLFSRKIKPFRGHIEKV